MTPSEQDPIKKKIYQELLSESIRIYEKNKSVKNSKPMIGLVKFCSSAQNVDMDKMTQLGLDYYTQGEDLIFSIYCILDSGAESNFFDIEILEMLKPPLTNERPIEIKSSDGNIRTSSHSYVLNLLTN